LLVHGIPGWQILRQQTPCRARPDHPAQAIEDLPQAMLALGSLFGYEGQIGGDQGPFLITDITGVSFAFHTARLASSGRKCITPSNCNSVVNDIILSLLPSQGTIGSAWESPGDRLLYQLLYALAGPDVARALPGVQ
jgi:hypothetical protein